MPERVRVLVVWLISPANWGACRVEEERGAGPTGSRPFPFPAHQTGRALFEHPAFRQTSPSAHGSFRHKKTQYTQFPEYNSVRELGRAQRRHFLATSQEHSYALIDVVIDRPICRVAIALAEVVGPASQRCIEAIPHFRRFRWSDTLQIIVKWI